MARKIILNLAMSLDGYIAREDGSFDWIVGDGDKSCDTSNTFDFDAFLETVDVIVMGKLAFLDAPKEGLDMFTSKQIYVATHEEIETDRENVSFFSDDVVSKISEMRDEEGKNIWIYGGAGLADALVKADVIDEYIVGIVPIILGKGRPLFLANNPTLELHLEELSSQKGVVILKYTRRENT